MEYQTIINVLDDTTNQPSTFRPRNWVEILTNHEEHIMPIVILNLKLQWSGQIYVIIVMHTYMLKQL